MQLHDVICRREAGYAVVAGITQEWVWRSPAGFERGCGGGGPADPALNILLAASGDRDFSAQHQQAFQRRFVATLPASGGVIAAKVVAAWIRERDPGFAVEANPKGGGEGSG